MIKAYKEEVWPDMIGNHLPEASKGKVSSRRNRTVVENSKLNLTLNALTAEAFAGKFDKAFGADGILLKAITRRCKRLRAWGLG